MPNSLNSLSAQSRATSAGMGVILMWVLITAGLSLLRKGEGLVRVSFKRPETCRLTVRPQMASPLRVKL